ncbi:MAG: hypothetical protein E7099_09145 [Mediterranea massiliensis]|nr:hypothetical protein [Mediterranea massiliensis]
MKRKRISCITFVALILTATSYGIHGIHNENQLSETAMMNVEALANDEVSGNTVDCYSSSSAKKGSTYYDCGNCQKQYNAKGIGGQRQCIVN